MEPTDPVEQLGPVNQGNPIEQGDANPVDQAGPIQHSDHIRHADFVGHADRIDNVKNLHLGDVHHHHHHHHQQLNNIEADQLTSKSESLRLELLQKSADDIQHHQRKKLESSMVLRGLNVDQSKLPEVFQSLVESDIFKAKDPPKKEPFTPSTQRNQNKTKTFKSSQIIQFDKLLTAMMGIGFLAIVGPPGCGKTTLAKRLAKSAKFFVVFLRFLDLSYNLVLTPQQLLIDFPFKDIDQATRDNAFAWMLKNQEKCVFMFDGYDQCTWLLDKENPPNVSYDTPLSIQQLVANLCCKNIFSKSLLIFTSRPHSILSIPEALRPNVTVVVGDLSTDGMRKLFFALAGDEADKLWKTLHSDAPQLIELCYCPLLLQIVVFAGLHGYVNQMKTITKVFTQVLLQIEHSGFKQGSPFKQLVEPLGKIAFDGMVHQTVVFTNLDLKMAGLEDKNVQDFVIKVAFRPNLFEGDKAIFYFTHQIFQEMFAAMYICMVMPDLLFNKIIHQVVYESHWSMVRRFVCGLLLGDEHKTGAEKYSTLQQVTDQGMFTRFLSKFEVYTGKAETFRKKLIQFMKTDVSRYQLIDLLIDIQECSDGEKDFLAKFLPVKFYFYSTPISSSAAHALAQMLTRLKRPIEELDLRSCNLNADSLKLIIGGITKMKHKVEYLDLSENKLETEEIRIISHCFNKVKELRLYGCGIFLAGLEIICKEIQNLELPMEILGLNENEFGDDGVRTITCCLNKVRKLKLWYSGISEDGKQILREEVKKHGLPGSIVEFGLFGGNPNFDTDKNIYGET